MLDLYSQKVLDGTNELSSKNPDKIVWSRKWNGIFILLVVDPVKLLVLEHKIINKENIAPPENWEIFECIVDAQDTMQYNWDKYTIRETAENILDDIQEYDMF